MNNSLYRTRLVTDVVSLAIGRQNKYKEFIEMDFKV